MSEIVHVVGELSGLRAVAEWRAAKVDEKSVGKLTKHLGPLQAPTNVADVLELVTEIAGVGATVALDAAAGTLSVHAVVTDHQLHDLAAPLVGAFRLAGAAGARGVLVFVEGATDAPGFGHRLEVDDGGATVRELKKAELGAKFVHPARTALEALEERLAAAPPPPADVYPAALRDVPVGERPAYRAAWDRVAGADETTLVRAVASAAGWSHPDQALDPALAKLVSRTTKDEIVASLHAGDAGRVRGHLSVVLTLAPWIDGAKAAALSASARAAGTWPRYLCPMVRGLVASGDPAAEAEAWAIFDAASDDKRTEIDLWHGEGAATYGLSTSSVPTGELVRRLEAALSKKQKPAEKRVLGYGLMLAWRKDEPAARPAIEGAIAGTSGTLHACLVEYLKQVGWTRL